VAPPFPTPALDKSFTLSMEICRVAFRPVSHTFFFLGRGLAFPHSVRRYLAVRINHSSSYVEAGFFSFRQYAILTVSDHQAGHPPPYTISSPSTRAFHASIWLLDKGLMGAPTELPCTSPPAPPGLLSIRIVHFLGFHFLSCTFPLRLGYPPHLNPSCKTIPPTSLRERKLKSAGSSL